jgi:hypothetical protein
MTKEKQLERKFCKWCRLKGIEPVKGPAEYAKGIPDRFLQLPNGGGTIYVEFKGTSYYGLTALQEWWKKYLLDSDPNRYYFVEDDAGLAALQKRCEDLIAIGPALVIYEKQLLDQLEASK